MPIVSSSFAHFYRSIPSSISSFVHVLCLAKQKRPQYGAWYLPVNQWTIKKGENGTDQFAKRGHIFGGLVQQKLDDITKKRETDMKALMKENGEGPENTKSRKKRTNK